MWPSPSLRRPSAAQPTPGKLCLRVHILDRNFVTTVMFEPDTSVDQACRLIHDKHVALPEHGTKTQMGNDIQYGLFLLNELPGVVSRGVWLDRDKTLSYYMLRSNDLLQYKNRKRKLMISLLDGSLKTIEVDDRISVRLLMPIICASIGLQNHDEYCLMHDMTHRKKFWPSGSTSSGPRAGSEPRNSRKSSLSDVRYSPIGMAGRRTKKDKNTAHLMMDEQLDWVDYSKTLSEQGIDETTTVLLRRRFFYSDSSVDTRDPVQLNLLYIQCRDDVIRGSHPVSQELAVVFAGLQCQVQFGNFDATKHGMGFIDLCEFVPAEYVKMKTLEAKIIKEHQKNAGLSEPVGKLKYAQECRALPTYGVTFFHVQEKVKIIKRLVQRLLGVHKECVMILHQKSKQVIRLWSMEQIRRWAVSPKTFTLDLGDYETFYYTVKTAEGERIGQLLSGYIDIILKKKKLRDHFGIDGDEGSYMVEDVVRPLKASKMSVEDYMSSDASYSAAESDIDSEYEASKRMFSVDVKNQQRENAAVNNEESPVYEIMKDSVTVESLPTAETKNINLKNDMSSQQSELQNKFVSSTSAEQEDIDDFMKSLTSQSPSENDQFCETSGSGDGAVVYSNIDEQNKNNAKLHNQRPSFAQSSIIEDDVYFGDKLSTIEIATQTETEEGQNLINGDLIKNIQTSAEEHLHVAEIYHHPRARSPVLVRAEMIVIRGDIEDNYGRQTPTQMFSKAATSSVLQTSSDVEQDVSNVDKKDVLHKTDEKSTISTNQVVNSSKSKTTSSITKSDMHDHNHLQGEDVCKNIVTSENENEHDVKEILIPNTEQTEDVTKVEQNNKTSTNKSVNVSKSTVISSSTKTSVRHRRIKEGEKVGLTIDVGENKTSESANTDLENGILGVKIQRKYKEQISPGSSEAHYFQQREDFPAHAFVKSSNEAGSPPKGYRSIHEKKLFSTQEETRTSRSRANHRSTKQPADKDHQKPMFVPIKFESVSNKHSPQSNSPPSVTLITQSDSPHKSGKLIGKHTSATTDARSEFDFVSTTRNTADMTESGVNDANKRLRQLSPVRNNDPNRIQRYLRHAPHRSRSSRSSEDDKSVSPQPLPKTTNIPVLQSTRQVSTHAVQSSSPANIELLLSDDSEYSDSTPVSRSIVTVNKRATNISSHFKDGQSSIQNQNQNSRRSFLPKQSHHDGVVVVTECDSSSAELPQFQMMFVEGKSKLNVSDADKQHSGLNQKDFSQTGSVAQQLCVNPVPQTTAVVPAISADVGHFVNYDFLRLEMEMRRQQHREKMELYALKKKKLHMEIRTLKKQGTVTFSGKDKVMTMSSNSEYDEKDVSE